MKWQENQAKVSTKQFAGDDGKRIDYLTISWFGGAIGVVVSPAVIDQANAVGDNMCTVGGDLALTPSKYGLKTKLSVSQISKNK